MSNLTPQSKKKNILLLIFKPKKLFRRISRKLVKRLPNYILRTAAKSSIKHAKPIEPVSKRIVIVCGTLHAGGAERQLTNTLIHLKKERIESATLLCDRLQNEDNYQHDFYLPQALSSGWEVREINKQQGVKQTQEIPKSAIFLKYFVSEGLYEDVIDLYFEFQNLKPEVVHAWLDWSNIRAGLAAVLAGVPIVVLSGRNVSPKHFLFNTYFMRACYQALLDKKHTHSKVKLLNNSSAGAKDYSEWLGISQKRIIVLRNGVDFTAESLPSKSTSDRLLDSLNIPNNSPIVGSMFRFYPEKDPHLWAQTVKELCEINNKVHVIHFGDGIMKAEIEKYLIDHKLNKRVHLPGKISPPLHGLSLFDLTILTSKVEGTPNVLLESQWLGIPVVTTDAGGAAEAVDHKITGMVVYSRNPKEIAVVINDCLNNQEFISNCRTNAPKFISSRFGMNRMINETHNVYNNHAE